MLPGPVFNIELLTTSRRARYYFVRALYGGILLFFLYQTYSSFFWWRYQSSREISIREMSRFAQSTFATIGLVQLGAVLVLTPTILAGVIADEKQRRTLDYLLASRLSSPEIVLGKLAARLLHVGVFLAIGLPVVCMIGLFGGVDPELVTYTYIGTMTTAYFLAGLCLWISTTARRPRDAIFAVYLLELAWLALPPMLDAMVRWGWPWGYPYVQLGNQWLLRSNPFWVLTQILMPLAMGGRLVFEDFLWMSGIQTGLGSLLTILTVWRLRRVFKSQRGEAKRASRHEARWARLRAFRRPDCGNDPMLWKERFFLRSGRQVRWIVRILTVVGGLFMGYWLLYYGEPAFEELLVYGYGEVNNGARENFNVCLRTCGTILYVLWLLAVSAAAASGVTSEKEEDTWTSLTTTPLTGGEILVAKMIGAVWGMRFLAYCLFFLWGLGLITSAIHPFGVLAELVELAVFSWFAVALGTLISLRSKNTTRATAATVAVLAVLNVGYLMCCVPFRADSPFMVIPCTPAIFAMSAVSYSDLWRILGFTSSQYDRDSGEAVLACILGVSGYFFGALVLTIATVSAFDRAVDRPVRSLSPANWPSPRPDRPEG
jgi:ABC-type transport system involved in multi-copper enzyme maturation permease subunit